MRISGSFYCVFDRESPCHFIKLRDTERTIKKEIDFWFFDNFNKIPLYC